MKLYPCRLRRPRAEMVQVTHIVTFQGEWYGAKDRAYASYHSAGLDWTSGKRLSSRMPVMRGVEVGS